MRSAHRATIHDSGARERPACDDGAYRDGAEVQRELPLLSTYLGHVKPASTYWYLQAAPELLQLVGQRLDCLSGGQS